MAALVSGTERALKHIAAQIVKIIKVILVYVFKLGTIGVNY